MLLKNFMEDKQLDFNQPLLSVRRFSSTAVSSKVEDKRKTDKYPCRKPPLYKSELKSGPLRNPGTIPFLWEQIPGRPKDERKSQIQVLDRPPVAPKLPPGRILNGKQQLLDKGSDNETTNRPRMTNIFYSSQNASSLDGSATKSESSKEETEERQSSVPEDGDEVYMDAHDTLSRTKSFFINCSVSGLSGLEGADVKPSGTFSTDPETRDFMMDRFLPAAKAMASETPQYASRKQRVVQEQPRQVQKVVSGNKRPPLNQYKPGVVPYYTQNIGEEDSEDDDGEYDESDNLSGKVCGLFPRFCLLNPVPGMRGQGQVPVHSVRRTLAKASHAESQSAMEIKHVRNIAHDQRSMDGLQTTELHEDKSSLKSESSHVNSRDREGTSLYRRLQGGGISVYRNEHPQPLGHEEKGFLGIPEDAQNSRVNGLNSHKKSCKNFRELLASQSTKWESGAESPTVEKTLYIDSVHVAASPNSDSVVKGLTGSNGNEFEILLKARGMKETSSVDSALQDIKHLHITDKKVILQPKISDLDDSNSQSSLAILNQEMKMDTMEGFRQDQDVDDEKMDFENQRPSKEDIHDAYPAYPELPLPPPLPKSPSESWLWRTLPSVSSKNPFPHSTLGMQMHHKLQTSKPTTLGPKWETVVKTSNVHHGHLRFSEELLTPIPET